LNDKDIERALFAREQQRAKFGDLMGDTTSALITEQNQGARYP
jgi:hypothetical protein